MVFSLSSSSATSTAKQTLSPIGDIVVGLLVAAIAYVLVTGRDQPFRKRRRVKKDAKLKARREAGEAIESLALRMLGKGEPKVTFVVGAVLSFPGVSFLAELHDIHKVTRIRIPDAARTGGTHAHSLVDSRPPGRQLPHSVADRS